jgi:hypothetical protein
MKFLVLTFILGFSAVVQAEIQVPEDCINHAYPCLVRADANFEFKQDHLSITLTPKSILKITKEDKLINLELLTGRMSVSEKERSQETFSVNSVLTDGPAFMVKREKDELDILSLTKFVKTHYLISAQENVPVRVRSNFLSKSEFVDFTRHYFTALKDLKGFLASVEANWSAEFQKQNESQTKALMRSVASEEKAAEERIRSEKEKAQALKKAKEELFFRTFQR